MTVNRRQVLKGVSFGAGGVLLAPIVAKLRAEAAEAGSAAAAAAPKRFVFVVEGNGLPWSQIQPKGIARNAKLISSGGYDARNGGEARTGVVDKPLAGEALPPALEPVKAHRDRLTIIQGLSGKMTSGGHSNDFGALGAYNARGTPGSSGSVAGETVDHALGRRLNGLFPQIGLGISDRAEDTVIYNSSASGPGKALPTQCRPDLAYQALFGSVAGGDARKAFDTQKNLLDHMVADVKRAEAALAGPEREKLETYLHALENMRARHSRLVELEATLRKCAPPVTDKYKSEVETDRLDAHFDLAAAALTSGLTNVVTLASGVGNPYFSVRFRGLGVTLDKHSIGYGGGFEGKTADELSTAIRKFHFELIARLADKLKAVREGDGTMWDNTLIVYLSDAAEGHHSRCWEWPVVLLGNLGGKIKAGRYLELPGHGAKGHKHIGNLYTTLLNASGDNREFFGRPDPILGRDVDQRGPVAELLA